MGALSIEIATAEVNSWLDCKGIKERKREANKEQIDTLIDAFADGVLVLNAENHKITHKLIFPIEDENGKILTSELVYKPRIRVKEVQKYLKGVKNDDGDGRVNAYIAAISEQATSVIGNLESTDYSIGSALMVFFV